MLLGSSGISEGYRSFVQWRSVMMMRRTAHAARGPYAKVRLEERSNDGIIVAFSGGMTAGWLESLRMANLFQATGEMPAQQVHRSRQRLAD